MNVDTTILSAAPGVKIPLMVEHGGTQPNGRPGTFGDLLRSYRTKVGLTQEQLAERADLTPRGVAYLESGARTPHRTTLIRLADALHLEPSQRVSFQRAAARPDRDRDPADMPHPLAAPLTPIVGRERDESTALVLLRGPEVRLLTLTGTGGVGKTRLAQRVADQLSVELCDGLVSVALETIRVPELVIFAIARSLGVREEHGRALTQSVIDHLRDRELLLLLDNFEQVLSAAPILAEVLAAAPAVKAIVTSRAPLKIAGEHELVVPPLAVPNPSENRLREVASFSAVELFVQRARAVRHDFTLTDTNVAAVVDVCRRLDGLPLAIELAAARVRALTIQQLAERLRLGLQVVGASSTPGRHQTLRATMEWSHALLPEAERRLFRRLAVFAGGWTLEAVEAIGDIDAEAQGVLDVLCGLVDQSLVLVEQHGDSMRYRFLEPVREYAQEQLTQGGDGPQMHRRHADHFLGLAERAAAELSGERQLLSLDQLNREHANLRAALSWFRETGDPERKGLRMARALWRFWWLRSYSTEGRAQLAALLKLAGDAAPAPLRTQSLHGLGMLALRQGDTVEARDCLRSAFTVAEQADDRLDMAVALTGLGRLALDEGQVEEAHAYLERSLTLEREVLQGAGLGLTLTYLGWAAMFSGDHAKAHELLDEGLARFREVGDRDGEGRVLWSLGHLALECHELDRSRSFFLQAFRIDAELNYNHGLAIVLEGLADLAAAERSYERACRLAGSAAALRQAAGMVAPVEFKRRHERSIGAARAALDPDVAEARWFEGWNLSPDDILAEELAAAD